MKGVPENELEWWIFTLWTALVHPPRSTARADMIRNLAELEFRTFSGERRRFSESTLRRWIRRIESTGVSVITRPDDFAAYRAWKKHDDIVKSRPDPPS